MSEWLVALWSSLSNDQLYVKWPAGYLHGLLYESGVYDDTPLYNFVTDIVQSVQEIQRHLLVAADDSETGDYIVFDSDKIPISEMPRRVVSSASIPLVFPDQQFDGRVFMDGGTVYNTNLVSAVEKCLELVDSPTKIIMDIVICGHAEIDPIETPGNTITNFMRYRAIKKYDHSLDDVLEFQKTEPLVNYRYLVIPSIPLKAGLAELDFSPEATTPMVELGKQDAQNIVSLGKGKAFSLLSEWSSKAVEEKVEFKHAFGRYLHSFA